MTSHTRQLVDLWREATEICRQRGAGPIYRATPAEQARAVDLSNFWNRMERFCDTVAALHSDLATKEEAPVARFWINSDGTIGYEKIDPEAMAWPPVKKPGIEIGITADEPDTPAACTHPELRWEAASAKLPRPIECLKCGAVFNVGEAWNIVKAATPFRVMPVPAPSGLTGGER